ncbi:MAG: hypothetical protein WKF70_03005 [Chitinophagaceae bacterium]
MAAPEQQLIPLSNASAWKAALQDIPHAFGHTWESCYAMSLTTALPTYLYQLCDGARRVVCPIAERLHQGFTDIVTPYGFSGFVGNGAYTPFDQHWKQFARDRNYICGFIGLNPLFEEASFLREDECYGYNSLYVLDLTQTISVLLERLSYIRKRQLRQFDKQQLHLINDKALVKNFFVQHYSSFFESRGASGVYLFSPETMLSLINADSVFMAGVSGGKGIEAVSVFAYTPHGAEYLFNVSVEQGRQHSTTLIWYAVEHLQAMGIPWLNLGGGVTENDSIAQFKQFFGPQRYALRCSKQVYQPDQYRSLCMAANRDPGDRSGYFPAYRQ